MKFCVFALVLPLFLTAPAFAASDNPFQISDDLDQSIHKGLDELYNFNFEKSLAIFHSVESQEVEHPMIAFGVVSTHWWKITSYVLEADPEASKPFLDAVQKCIQVSEEKIKKGDKTGEGYLVLGGALGMLGRWQATNHQWLSAYWTGKKAYKNLTKALATNPQMLDANMGLGIFDYYVATLPSVVRVLAFLGMGGNPHVGIQELETAATKGTYARTPAKLFLMQIFLDREGKTEKAIKIIDELRDEYPKSPFMQMMYIIALYDAAQLDDLKSEAESFQDNVDSKIYSAEFTCQAHFVLGLVPFKSRDWKDARDEFQKAFSSGKDSDPWKTWAALYTGFCNDVLNNREASKERYQWVLNHLRRWGSHDLAKSHLKKPFQGTPEDLKKLSL